MSPARAVTVNSTFKYLNASSQQHLNATLSPVSAREELDLAIARSWFSCDNIMERSYWRYGLKKWQCVKEITLLLQLMPLFTLLRTKFFWTIFLPWNFPLARLQLQGKVTRSKRWNISLLVVKLYYYTVSSSVII